MNKKYSPYDGGYVVYHKGSILCCDRDMEYVELKTNSFLEKRPPH